MGLAGARALARSRPTPGLQRPGGWLRGATVPGAHAGDERAPYRGSHARLRPRSDRAHRHPPRPPPRPGGSRGRRREPGGARAVPPGRGLGAGRAGRARPGRDGRGRHDRGPHPLRDPGRRGRPGLLHARVGGPAGRGAAGPGRPARALRLDLVARAEHEPADAGGRPEAPVRGVRGRQARDRAAALRRDRGRRAGVDRRPPRPHQRRGLAGDQPGRQPRPAGVGHHRPRRGAGRARRRVRDHAPRARRRRGAGLRAGARRARGLGGRVVPRGEPTGADRARLRRGRVRAGGATSPGCGTCRGSSSRRRSGAEHATTSWEHLHRSQVCSIAKGVDRLGYSPAWTSEATAREAVAWLAANDAAHDLPALVRP